MDKLAAAFYRLKFENLYLKLKSHEFQDLFARIMELAHPTSFLKVRLTQGDGGLDGFMLSSHTVFAVFAPRETTLAKLNAKINDDFKAASNTMDGTMKRWVFVHNDPEAVTKTTAPLLSKLATDHPHIEFEVWGEAAIWNVIKSLSDDEIESLLGQVPTVSVLDQLSYEDLKPVLDFIEGQPIPADAPVNPPNVDKLQHNNLSVEIQDILQLGRRREELVQRYFENCNNPELGEQIAEAFRQRYQQLRDAEFAPDSVFHELRIFAGGNVLTKPIEQAAVTAVLSHLFESCDIFENSPSTDE